MFQPEMIREHWTTLSPKIKELWPKVSDADLQQINGDVELLVTKVGGLYNIGREEIFNKLEPFLTVPVDKATGKTR